MEAMLNGLKPLRGLALAASLAALGCHAQTPIKTPGAAAEPVQVGVKLSPSLARRIEVMIRSKADIAADYNIAIGTPAASPINGYDRIDISFSSETKSTKPTPFLISTDGKTLAQLNQFDISQDPSEKVSAAGRPSRGGPPSAPVTIVVFDDLECPFCAVMNDELIPAVMNRYKDQVRIVYRDFPLEELHPWAKHAAIDAECLASASTPAYWSYVDYVHAHAADMAGAEKTADKAGQSLDKIALDEGTKQKVDQSQLISCVLKQDPKAVNMAILQGEAEPLHLSQAPVVFINGEKLEGITSVENMYRIVDRALVAAGQTPPPLPPPAKAAPAAARPGS
jgi:protein-disulfide isomerase